MGDAAKVKVKLKVGVICGGSSSEHSVSCLSAASLLKSIDRDHFEVTLIGITQKGKWVRLKDDPSLISLKEINSQLCPQMHLRFHCLK